MRARTTAGASHGMGRGARYITHHLDHHLPAASYIHMMTLGLTASPTSFFSYSATTSQICCTIM